MDENPWLANYKEVFMSQNLLNVDELAEKLHVPKSWVYARTRERDRDAIPMVKVGKYCRFFFPDVLDWLENKQNERSE